MPAEWKGSRTAFLLGGLTLFLFVAIVCLFPLVECPQCRFYSDIKAGEPPGFPVFAGEIRILGQPCKRCGNRNDAGRITLLNRWHHGRTIWIAKD